MGRPQGSTRTKGLRRVAWYDAIGGITETDRDGIHCYEGLKAKAVGQMTSSVTRVRVDCGTAADGSERAQLVLILARKMVAKVQQNTGWPSVDLLDRLSIMDRSEQWRDVAFAVTGETNPMAQGACVRMACRSLRVGMTRSGVTLEKLVDD